MRLRCGKQISDNVITSNLSAVTSLNISREKIVKKEIVENIATVIEHQINTTRNQSHSIATMNNHDSVDNTPCMVEEIPITSSPQCLKLKSLLVPCKMMLNYTSDLYKVFFTFMLVFLKYVTKKTFPKFVSVQRFVRSYTRLLFKGIFRYGIVTRSCTRAVKTMFNLTNLFHFINTITIIFCLWKCTLHHDSLPDPRDVGLNNCEQIAVTPRIPAWYIFPKLSSNLSLSDVLDQGLPIILSIRDSGSIDVPHRINVLRTLSSLHFHIITPVYKLNNRQIINVWEFLTKQSKTSTVYVWFNYTDITLIKQIANTMCAIRSPPSAIIMESKKNDFLQRLRTLEMWSSKCQTNNTSSKFTFVKCPLSMQSDDANLRDDIAACFRAIEINTSL